MQSSRIAAHTLRALAVQYGVDPRSIVRELASPGSVRGLAGERARAAIASFSAVPCAGDVLPNVRRMA